MNRQALRVRRAGRADLAALLALEESTFSSDRISRRQWRRHLDSRSATVLACGAVGDVEAVAVVFYRRHTRHARLYSLAVRSDRRGEGLGLQLLAAAETDARGRGCHTISLEVGTRNRAAIALYERSGYQRLARLRRFYEDGGDAWRCAKSLQPA
ncbi:MAG TPA: GNAT family N-acetyltransferase [Rhodanobacteraceae bacterium]|jgi:ribosomal protein S18 acetylase RimI-like enzyme|nr:GNAT family N-acetyltransferase [Rhodanobacteraceae bacterium]